MSDVTVLLERIVCRQTTEAGHDEVYYLSPSIIRRTGDITSADTPFAPGPTLAQAANAGGPGGDNTALNCNDSGDLSDQLLNVDLFPVSVDPGDHVAVTIVTNAFQIFKSFPGNQDDPLGPVTFALDADGSNVRFRQVGIAAGSLTETSADGTPGRVTARLRGL